MIARSKHRTPAELAADGFAALVQELGPAEAIRFLQLYYPGKGNYTEDRHRWLDPLTHAEVADLMRVAPKKRPKRKRSA